MRRGNTSSPAKSRATLTLVMTVTVALILAVAPMPAAGQSPSVGSRGCNRTFFSSLVQLLPCRPAVAPFSSIQPSDTCCAAVRLLGQPCLCVLINGPPISGVDRIMASQLPTKCSANFDACDSGN